MRGRVVIFGKGTTSVVPLHPLKTNRASAPEVCFRQRKRDNLRILRHGRGSALPKGSRPCDSRNRQQNQKTSRRDFQFLQIGRCSRAAERRVGRHQYYFRVVGGIVTQDHRRPRRMPVHPFFERPNLVGRVLPNFGRRNIARINVRHILLSAYRVAQAATDVVLFPAAAARLIQAASVNVRRHLRPLRLRVFLPGLCRRHHRREDRA
jgi:hypothetical protein